MSYTPEYTKKNFVNDSAPPLSADNMNDIESGISNIEEYLTSLDPVSIELHKTTGTPVATITIGGIGYVIYCDPSSGEIGNVGWQTIQASGTKIGEITINDETLEVFAPPIIDGLENTSATSCLSANQGKVLNETKAKKPKVYSGTISAGQSSTSIGVPRDVAENYEYLTPYVSVFGVCPTDISITSLTTSTAFFGVTIPIQTTEVTVSLIFNDYE